MCDEEGTTQDFYTNGKFDVKKFNDAFEKQKVKSDNKNIATNSFDFITTMYDNGGKILHSTKDFVINKTDNNIIIFSGIIMIIIVIVMLFGSTLIELI